MTEDDAMSENATPPAIDPSVPPSGTGCADCEAADPPGWWVHLRRCAACGHVGCCDTSPAQHASAHAAASGHPVVQTFEPGEDWFWHYGDEAFVEGPELTPPTSRPARAGLPRPAGTRPRRLARPHPPMTGALRGAAAVPLEPLAVPAGPASLPLLPRLAAALAGGAPVLPYAASSPPPSLPAPDVSGMPDDLAVVVGTSGSTGSPKLAMLTTGALRASAAATHDRLGGPGQWLLTLPAHHVAGLQVLLRSVHAGTEPVVMDLTDGFTPTAFVTATARLATGVRHYTSLVPTQLARLLDHAGGTEALAAHEAVIVGGAALPPSLRARAGAAGVRVVATYGMSETCGGCVYDGRPFPCTDVALDDDGRVRLGGATLAAGYLGRPDLGAAAFVRGADGIRRFLTDDVGHLDDDGRLHVDGRLDDLINTGGLKVAPRVVEEAIEAHVPGVREVVVVGTPHPEWGQAVSALVVVGPDAPPDPVTTADLRARLRDVLPAHALPVRVLQAAEVPLTGPGKPDRRSIAAMFTVG